MTFSLAAADGFFTERGRFNMPSSAPGLHPRGRGAARRKLPSSRVRAGHRQASARIARGFPHITPHDLRRTAASLAVSAGANVKMLQRMLGHASAAMTLDVYADLFPEDLTSVSIALDRAARDWFVGKPNVPQ